MARYGSLGFNRDSTYYSEVQSLIDALAGTTPLDTQWVPNFYTKKSSLQVSKTGTASFTVQVEGSNAYDHPKESDVGVQIGADITAVGLTEITMPCRWIRAKVTAISAAAGTLSAVLHQIR